MAGPVAGHLEEGAGRRLSSRSHQHILQGAWEVETRAAQGEQR